MIQDQIKKGGYDSKFDGHYFMLDFEYAMRAALATVWPLVTLMGCYFHWTQLIIKRVRKSGFAKAYTKIHKFNSFIRRICSLPWVPPFLMDNAMDIIQRRSKDLGSSLGPEFEKFSSRLIKYIERTWMNKLFKIQDWNFFDVNSINIPVTNNGNEGTNSILNSAWVSTPQEYVFALQVVEELDIIENVKLPDLRSGRPTGNKSRKDKQQKKNEEREEAKKLLLEKVKLENKDDKESIDALDEYMGTMGGHGATMGEQKLDSDFGRNADLEDLSDDEDWVAAGDTNRVFHDSPATAALAAVESAKSVSSVSAAVDALLQSTDGGRGRGQGGQAGRAGRAGREGREGRKRAGER